MKTTAFVLLLSVSAFAKTYIIKNDRAKAYDGPSTTSAAVGHVVKGKKINSVGEDEGFIQVQTKTGRIMWIKLTDVEEAEAAQPMEVAQNTPAAETPTEQEDSGPSEFRLTWDLGAAGGSYRGETYNEIDLGVNAHFNKWFIWRNAGFMRFVQPKNYYGLDSSARFVYEPTFIPGFGVTLYGGPGYRILFSGVDGAGNSAPLAEAGLTLHIGSFHLGGGIKTVFQSFADKNVGDDTQFFITISGGGVIN
jgi:hypothetical protein